jgi:hypothetical protein
MATKTTVAVEVSANTSKAEGAVSSFKKQLREATAELVAINEKFGATSQEAINAAKRVAGLKDAIGDAKDLAAAFNPDAKFKALSQALSTAAGGFAAVQGAQALFGAQSEDLEKTLVKVQGALALSQGLEQLGGLADAFKNLKAVAVNAFNGIKTAIGSTGIGLLVIALGAIYAYWDDIKEAVSGVNAEQQKQNDLLKESVKKEEEKLTFIERNEATLRLQGKSEKEILQLKVEAVKGEIEKQKQLIISNKLINDQRVAAAQQNYEILKGFLDFISIPQRKIYELFSSTINKIIDVANKLPGIDIKFKVNGQLAEDAPDWLAKKVFNVEEIKKQGDKANKEAQQQLETLTNKQSGYVLGIQKIDSDAAAEAAKNRVEDLNIKKIDFEAVEKITLDTETKKSNIKIDASKIAGQQGIKNQDEIDAIMKKKYENDLAAKQAVENQKAQAVGNALGAISNLIGQDTAAGKALGIAQALINTYIGASEAIREKSLLPQPYSTISKIASVAAILATGFKTVKSIAGVKVPKAGGGGGGASVPSTASIISPMIAPQAQVTRLDQGQINQIGNAASRAYVVESDVSNGQERINRLNRAARIN